MKPIRLISTGTLALLLGVLVPAYAQQDQGAKPEPQHEQQTKPAKKQKAAKPSKQERKQAKAEQKEQQKEQRTANQNQPRQDRTEPAHEQQARGQQHGQPQGHWAHDGQKDSRGHVYSQARFGPDHHAHFDQNGGRFYNGHREYSFGGYWFYADAWPAWFYQQDVYFVLGDDGLWYAVSYDDPSLMIQVNIE